jgi:hypothetical protein
LFIIRDLKATTRIVYNKGLDWFDSITLVDAIDVAEK